MEEGRFRGRKTWKRRKSKGGRMRKDFREGIMKHEEGFKEEGMKKERL